MNHIRRFDSQSLCNVLNACHPERSLATSEASRQTQSKDPYHHDAADGGPGNFCIVVRFFEEGAAEGTQGAEYLPKSTREAAAECSPRREPWESVAACASPVGAKETPAGQNRQ